MPCNTLNLSALSMYQWLQKMQQTQYILLQQLLVQLAININIIDKPFAANIPPVEQPAATPL